MSFSRVVLPQPLGPSTTIVWPSGTRRVKSRIATVDLRPPPQIPEDSLSVLQTSRRSICAIGTPRRVRRCDNVAWYTIVANRPRSHARVCDLRSARNGGARRQHAPQKSILVVPVGNQIRT